MKIPENRIVDLPIAAYEYYQRFGFRELLKNSRYRSSRWLLTHYSRYKTRSNEELKSKFEYHTFKREGCVEISYHGSNKELPPRLSDYLGAYKKNNVCVFDINDGIVGGNHGFAYTPDGSLILETAGSTHSSHAKHILNTIDRRKIINTICQKSRQSLESKVRIGHIFVLSGRRGGGYSHWLDETLPRIYLFKEYKKKTGTSPTLVFNRGLSEHQTQSLELLGVEPEEYIELPEEGIKADVVSIPELRLRSAFAGFETAQDELLWIKDTILRNIPDLKDHSYSSRVFISRRDSPHSRHITNEDELLSRLREYGFEPYILSDMNFTEQIKLMNQAEIVIGAHGAGLINTLWATDIDIVELLRSRGRPHYFVLANELGHRYEFILCEPVQDASVIGEPIGRNISAPVGRIVSVIDDLVTKHD